MTKDRALELFEKRVDYNLQCGRSIAIMREAIEKNYCPFTMDYYSERKALSDRKAGRYIFLHFKEVKQELLQILKLREVN